MSIERLTQCPHCQASFKVSEEQLGVANGRVRCGSCMNIFDAIAYSITESDAEAQSKFSNTQHSSDSPLVDLEDTILSPPKSQEPLFQDNPDEDKKEEGYSGTSRINDELSDTFLDLDSSQSDSDENPYVSSIQEVDVVDNTDADESWTSEILDNIHTDASDRIEPNISDSPEQALQEPEHEGFDTDLLTSDPSQHDTKTTSNKNNDYANYNFYQQDDRSNARHWLVSISLFLLITVLTTTLLAQASWLHYEKLSQYPQAAKLYEMACERLKCTLPVLSDIKKIKSYNLIVRSHPTTPSALIIDATIVNSASFGQDFPKIALYFSDINNKTIAQRLINPNEYLSEEILNWEKFPPEQPIHISLEIIDPGKEAVNYSLRFFSSPTASLKE